MRIADHLGEHSSEMLETEPFAVWSFQRSVDDDVGERIVYNTSEEHGLEVHCDRNERITTLFLDVDRCSEGERIFFEIDRFRDREQVLRHFGVPAKSGSERIHPILGEYGAWDRFTNPVFSIHFEYKRGFETVKKITLMLNELVPGSSSGSVK